MELLDSDVPTVENLTLQAREVAFDWSAMPAHFVFGNPAATHLLNVMNLLLPAGERWFVATYKEALPLVEDERLREEMIGFIGQESVHAHAHEGIQEFLDAKGIDYHAFLARGEWLFGQFLGPRPLTALRAQNYLVERLAIIAGAVGHCGRRLALHQTRSGTGPAVDPSHRGPGLRAGPGTAARERGQVERRTDKPADRRHGPGRRAADLRAR
ncbi:metal-dependent hydrolase [Nocardia sp. NPDC020380]|uniref:metal-dependent hydrolase n=1 Tax=Nocardia sp. NPDC020380 TaxID=3364309 RepID=UPI0037B01C1D